MTKQYFKGYGSNPTKHWPCDYWFNAGKRCHNPGTFQAEGIRKDGYIPYYCWWHKLPRADWRAQD